LKQLGSWVTSTNNMLTFFLGKEVKFYYQIDVKLYIVDTCLACNERYKTKILDLTKTRLCLYKEKMLFWNQAPGKKMIRVPNREYIENHRCPKGPKMNHLSINIQGWNPHITSKLIVQNDNKK